ncbi:hypothetical protein [Streptomyces sp. AC555_RSS877]|uniref:hypothetical protein n=1 Tax=Streptomyces sp. AC555_RSS877 TaxID=2823688 RepID=UPI0020B78240|nr:hypothetical protein [Streptomyces sp. AC555_RSS877]
MTGQAKASMWTGTGLCAGGAAGLVGLALTVYALFSGGGGTSSVTAGGARSVETRAGASTWR